MAEKSKIAHFYCDKSVFVTGATGFMGKVLVEKLLRSCPDISQIYVLMRPAKGKDVRGRLEELIENQVFDRVRQSGVLSKLVAVAGDVTFPGLGLSNEDVQKLIENVSVVFHSAATIKFNEDLKTAVEINVNGTRALVEICREMRKLEALIHVSTAYCNPSEKESLERIYPTTSCDPLKVVDIINSLPRNLVDKWTPDLLGASHPNTYTFTKALTEQILEKERGNLPLAIVRPSIVIAALREPFPGWVDNLNGATGMVIGLGAGLVRIIKVDPKVNCNGIPVDICINLMITAGYQTACNSLTGIKVYHCTPSNDEKNLTTLGSFLDYVVESWKKNPYTKSKRSPAYVGCRSELVFRLGMILFHLLPAFLLDLTSGLLPGSRKSMVKKYEKVHKYQRVVEPFMHRGWNFISENAMKLWNDSNMLTDYDRKVFNFNVLHINWKTYIDDYVLGVRRYVLKDRIISADDEHPVDSVKQPLYKQWKIWVFATPVMMLLSFLLY